MASITLLDIAKKNGSSKEVGLIESVMDSAPELAKFPARTVKGSSFQTIERTALPATGFTHANEGIVAGKSSFAVKTVECFIFRGAVNADKAVADAWDDGAASYQAIEADGVMRSAAIEIGKQIYYGTGKDAKGFPGLQAITLDSMTVNAGGSSEDCTSVYAVKFGPQFVQVVYGGNNGLKLDPFRVQSVFDGNGGQYAAYVSELTAWVGLQCVNPYAVGRICNISGGTVLNDEMLADLIAKFPVGFTPDAIIMNRRSLTQLQKSRTVILEGDVGGFVGLRSGLNAPVPTQYGGIPIIVTDNLHNAEEPWED